MTAPQLAISNEFMEALARLPKPQRKKVQEFAKKFRADPKSSAINYEKIHGVDDDRVRTVRIDQKYRAVVLHPDQGNTYVLVWVDNHDEAMDWARNRTFEVHPETQSLQILNVEYVNQAIADKTAIAVADESLLKLDDNTLLSFGVPSALVPAVKNLTSKHQLAQLQPALPEEAYEALVWLAEGESVADVKRVVGLVATPTPTNIDGKETQQDDDDQLLSNPQSLRRFQHVTNDEELDRVLEAPLEHWRIFLHPLQRQLAGQSFAGPTLVLGGAGTGKTIVAMHRARQLALKLQDHEKLLFTTFTKNLADNVRSILRTLCGDEVQRIDVQHIHELAMSWIKNSGPIAVASDEDIALAWDQVAMENPSKFETDVLRDEWFYVHAIKGIENRTDYLEMSRVGRTPAFSRRDRASIWNAFELFEEISRQSGRTTWTGIVSKAAELACGVEVPPYRHVIVDEGQDFTACDWKYIRALVKPGQDDIFIVADPRQRIYHEPTLLTDGKIEIADRIHRLQINYRTTEQIRRWATKQCGTSEQPDLCESTWTNIATHSLLNGPDPVLLENTDHESEAAAITKLVSSMNQIYPLEEIAIVARASWIFKLVKSSLANAGIKCFVIDGKKKPGPGVQLATMHRVKGLEFRCVIIAGLATDVFPNKFRGRADDQRAKRQHLVSERNLLYVAASRARDQLFVSTVGDFSQSPFCTIFTADRN
ncbi:MAG TPA: hypothetical protein DDZ51_13080 [Planctomycetaceae bacterium]|nr:hypothetical protein [Planctomycetaceae bacterium]